MGKPASDRRLRILDLVEWLGNRLPDPVTLFVLGTLVVMALSHVGASLDWQVTERLPRPVVDEHGDPVLDPETGEPQLQWQVMPQTRERIVTRVVTDEAGEPVIDEQTGRCCSEVVIDEQTGEPKTEQVELDQPRVHGVTSLLTAEGLFWALRSMVGNFVEFPPLGVVLVGMLGIGLAERAGLIQALLKLTMMVVPPGLLTPTVVFTGIMSSLATDAGYIVLPPLAAALYQAMGRSPLAGIAAAFAGVSAGFSANLAITALDPMLAEFTAMGARVVHEGYVVNPMCNWAFMIASTVLMTFVAWFVTARFVERRLRDKPADEGGPGAAANEADHDNQLASDEKRGLVWAGRALIVTLGVFAAMILVPGMPLHGQGSFTHRWVEVIVPLLLFVFAVPGLVYGIVTARIRNDRDAAKMLIDTMAGMAPIIVLAFVAAQFIAHFEYSGLDRVLAMSGGQWLGRVDAGPAVLVVGLIAVTAVFNLFIGSMSAKYALFAPIFVPMLMLVGISPELTQVAYRIGDSVSNIITPLNPYLVIILVFVRRYVPRGGVGTLIATMVPYTVAFAIAWTLLLLAWMALGLPLGMDGGLWYDVAGAG